jgi:four helix bundle protein
MTIKTLEELEIWQDARRFAFAVSAIVQRPSMRRDPKLANQLADSSSSIFSNISEGFGQSTDRAFAHYLSIARGSNNEAFAQLAVAWSRGHISEAELSELQQLSSRMGKRMTSLIEYLRRESRSSRC